MKAKVIETGEIINVCCLYPTTYSRLDCNGKIVEEYDEDEIELLLTPKAKTVKLDDAVEWIKNNIKKYINWEYNEFHHAVEYDGTFDIERCINDFKKALE